MRKHKLTTQLPKLCAHSLGPLNNSIIIHSHNQTAISFKLLHWLVIVFLHNVPHTDVDPVRRCRRFTLLCMCVVCWQHARANMRWRMRFDSPHLCCSGTGFSISAHNKIISKRRWLALAWSVVLYACLCTSEGSAAAVAFIIISCDVRVRECAVLSWLDAQR